MEILWFLLGLLAVGVGFIAFVILLIYGVSIAFSPTPPDSQLKSFAKNMMNYEFGEGGYSFMESKSQNNHPDRPQGLTVELTDEELSKLMKHIESLSEGEKVTRKDGTIYVDTIIKLEDRCRFIHTSTYASCDYMFYKAEGEVNYKTKIVTFKSSGY